MAKTLSKQIIFGSDQDVSDYLKTNPEINVIDEYGYTPLIQAAIVNSKYKTELLLNVNADVNMKDITGRSALHWATDNGNFEVAELLLKSGADANSYTNGGQSVLVLPLLRKQNKLIKLLLKFGATLNFAHDFINAKQIGHRFELEGRTDIVDHQRTFIETELEGFYLEFSLELLYNSLFEFRNNYGGKHLRQSFNNLNIVLKSLKTASELLKFQHYLYLLNIHYYDKQIDALLDNEPLILPVSFTGHAISLIKFWNLLIRCDRGEFGQKHGTVIAYSLPNSHAFDKSLMKELLFKRQSKEFVNLGLERELRLEPIWELPLPPQKAGNCSWANMEAVLPTMLTVILQGQYGNQFAEKSKAEAMKFYQEWLDWDRNRELHFCIESFYEANPARKAAKATLLASVFFQHCHYDDAKDFRKARKIIQILTIPEYDYILKSYLKVFAENPKYKELSENLHKYLSEFGINL